VKLRFIGRALKRLKKTGQVQFKNKTDIKRNCERGGSEEEEEGAFETKRWPVRV
jgi:hypothetical protein